MTQPTETTDPTLARVLVRTLQLGLSEVGKALVTIAEYVRSPPAVVGVESHAIVSLKVGAKLIETSKHLLDLSTTCAELDRLLSGPEKPGPSVQDATTRGGPTADQATEAPMPPVPSEGTAR